MLRTIIIDDHFLILEGLKKLLELQPNITVVGCATTIAESIELLENTPNIALIFLDINLPDGSGVELCKVIKKRWGIPVITLSTFHQHSYVTNMLESGASAYLLKNADTAEITKCIHTVMQGQPYFSEALQYNDKDLTKEKITLTRREKEILQYISNGFTNAQIANMLFISIDTVNTHRKNLHTKLNVTNTASLIKAATDNGFLLP